MTRRSADVVVIGGGVNGTSIAMHLARMGAGKVLLLEKGHLAGGATGRSGAMIREHYQHPVLVKMAMEASEIYHNFADAVGGDARFTETGRVLLFGAEDAAAVRANFQMNRDLGVNIHIITPAEVSEIVPQVCTDGVALGLYEPDSGSRRSDGNDLRIRRAGQAPRRRDRDRMRGHGRPSRGRTRSRRGDGGRTCLDGRCRRGDRPLGKPACRAAGRDPSDHAPQGADGALAAPAVFGVAHRDRDRLHHRRVPPG